MSALRALRITAVAAAGLAASAVMWSVLRPVEPHLDVVVRRERQAETFEVWTVRVRVRGGETVDEVRIEPLTGPVHVITPPRSGLLSGVTAEFRVQLDEPRTSKGAVRIVQTGRVSRTYDEPLVEPF